MNTIKITVEVEKKLALPVLYNDNENWDCIANSSAIDCSSITNCENCLFDASNYKTLLEQEKGD